jgi:hypothetical protein
MSRRPFAYVVSVDGPQVTLNLRDEHKGQLASHPDGIVSVTDIGSLFGVDAGSRLLVLRVQSLRFAEPKEAHLKLNQPDFNKEPLRHLVATVVGVLRRKDRDLTFIPDSLISPSLGAEAYPLSHSELAAILNLQEKKGESIRLGETTRSNGSLWVDIDVLLSRHVAVLGGTGQGKSSFTAAILQQILKLPNSRIVLFDINGEYEQALKPHLPEEKIKITKFGQDPEARIPYYALGRHGLGRLFLPSEKTQRPALNFALENLHFVEWSDSHQAARLVGTTDYVLVEDCRPGDANPAADAIDKLRTKKHNSAATKWPHMMALASLVAESYSLKPSNRSNYGNNNNRTYERGGFEYGNISPLINRIRRLVEDPLFTSVVDVGEGQVNGGKLNWQKEATALVDQIFGSSDTEWNLHIVDLRSVAHDLLPMILGSLLELLAFELFKRGQGVTHPTLLVLEEAHHYLRQLNDNDETGKHSLAYERLAKEGRKFGVSIWLSTQRPSELSPTVLSQCGTWVVFRLASEQDLRAVSVAAEWVDKQEVSRIAGLPRRQAVVFGSCVALPTRIVSPTADPTPKSHDPDFKVWTKTNEEIFDDIFS